MIPITTIRAMKGKPATVFTAVPPELQRSIPREVVLNGSGRFVMVASLAMLAGALVLGVTFYFLAVDGAARGEEIAGDARSTSGAVTYLGRSKGKEDRRVVEYTYRVDGRQYSGQSRLRRRDWRNLKVGSPVKVVYRGADPADSWVAGYGFRPMPLWAVPLAPLGLLAGALGMQWNIRRQRYLLTYGRAVLARVMEVSDKEGKHGVHCVKYEYTALDGSTGRGQLDLSEAVAPGSNLLIVHDPDRPTRRLRYPAALVKVRQGF